MSALDWSADKLKAKKEEEKKRQLAEFNKEREQRKKEQQQEGASGTATGAKIGGGTVFATPASAITSSREAAPKSILLRIRTQFGTWKIENVNIYSTFGDLRKRIETEQNTKLFNNLFYKDITKTVSFTDDIILSKAGLSNADMLFITADENFTAKPVHVEKKIVGGNIVMQEHEEVANKVGFRPGLLSLRSMKMQWKLHELNALDDRYTFRFENLKKSDSYQCKADFDFNVQGNSFATYAMSIDFRKIRVAYLYGTFTEGNTAHVECLYEPPQEGDEFSFRILEDPKQAEVDKIAGYLKIRKVGWIFCHPPRAKDFMLSHWEVLQAAEEQLFAANGVEDTPFVTMRCTIGEQGPEVSAVRVSKLCMAMAAEGAILPSSKGNAALNFCDVHPTFTAIVETKPTKEINNFLFLSNVPINGFDSKEASKFLHNFPPANRPERPQTQADLKKELMKARRGTTKGWTYNDVLYDFNLLLFLSDSMGDDMADICDRLINRRPIVDPTNPDDGYGLLFNALLDM